MKSGWVDSEAQAAIDRYAAQGVGRDLAARVYTTRLLGRDPRLVLHGGGNTSVETERGDVFGGGCAGAATLRSRRRCAIFSARRSRCFASRARAPTWR